MVGLYATFAHEKLLPFLKRSNNYPIQQAFDICKAKLFYPEMVYLLGRMGNTREALTIILQKVNKKHNKKNIQVNNLKIWLQLFQLKDINVAIDFCKEHNDIDLWSYLIDESVDDPIRMTILLDNIVGYVNPIALVNKIKPGKNLPGLKLALIKMLSQYNLQVRINNYSSFQPVEPFYYLYINLPLYNIH